MNRLQTGQQITRQLFKIRNRFDSAASAQKLQLLQYVSHAKIRSSTDLCRLHAALCYVRAFPDSIEHYRHACLSLQSFEDLVNKLSRVERTALDQSGIVGSAIHYRFSYAVAIWLARRIPGAVSIDWEDLEDTMALDELLTHLLEASDDDYFQGGNVSSEEWVSLASAHRPGTDFDWLLAHLNNPSLVPFWSQLYDSADLPLSFDLRGAKQSKTFNTAPTRTVRTRERGMRKRVRNTKSEIARPVDSLDKLSPSKGAGLIDVAMAALAVRHRETYHFNHANPKEVYLADVGEGISIAVFGLLPKYRFALECTMGYLILSNGVPIGYGGSSVLFRQVNTGINIFDEYRDSEASFLWVQVMRVYHHLVGCTRFIANAYQFGGDNDEALKSGAFWFYYRLGYRPVVPAVRKLAQREADRIRRDKKYRSDLPTLRRLGSCDMHLTLPGARASELFEEDLMETSSMLATQELGAAGGNTRVEAADIVAKKVARDIGLRSINNWSATELRALRRLAPIVAAAKPAAWPAAAKRSMRKLLRAKGSSVEAEYAALLREHDQFRKALRANCRNAELS